MDTMFEHILAIPRRMGHTTAASAGAAVTHGLVVATTHNEALRLQKEHNIDAISLEKLNNRVLGLTCPVVFDLDAIQDIIIQMNREINFYKELYLKEKGTYRDTLNF
jgi:hypothetical protein